MFKNFIAGVALALICVSSASAEFIIDSFNGVSTHNLPGGVTVSRTTSGTTSFAPGGTNATISSPGLFSTLDLTYTFSGPLSGTGDLLGGTPGLKIDFLGGSGNWLLQTKLGAGAFSSGVTFTAGAAPFSVAYATPGLLGVSSLVLKFVSTSGADSLVIDRLTATPEPTSMLMLGSCLLGGVLARRRFKTAKAV